MDNETLNATGGTMTIQFSNSAYFLLLLALVPAVIYTASKAKHVLQLLSNYSGQNERSVKYVKTKIICRIVFWSFSWVCLCIALSGPSWGTALVPVQRSGRAVSFVFDISYSMTAQDAEQGKTRLESSKEFTQSLVSVLPGVAASAVLAKGDGVLAVPLTEDYYSLSNLIVSLSPAMLSHPGSSLAKGVLKAVDSFPPQSARSSYIIVMSDGDDTDDNLEEAVDTALSYGIDVIFVGFGSETEVEVIAGDGETRVKTALRADKLKNLAQKDSVDFVLANESDAIGRIVKIINPSIFLTDDATTTGYENETIKRHGFFISLALLFFCLGFFIYTLDPQRILAIITRSTKTSMFLLLILSNFLFSGCSNDWFTDARDVLEGSYYWTRQEYQESVATFLEVTTRSQENTNNEILQYGYFGLSANYLMQGELQASLLKINEMDPVVSKSLDFARWYNKGVIFHRQGDYRTAAFCFKKALLIDSSNLNAKINLELCSDESTAQARQGIQERIPAQEQVAPPGADDAIFSLIRESEEDQWQAKEVAPEESNIIDY